MRQGRQYRVLFNGGAGVDLHRKDAEAEVYAQRRPIVHVDPHFMDGSLGNPDDGSPVVVPLYAVTNFIDPPPEYTAQLRNAVPMIWRTGGNGRIFLPSDYADFVDPPQENLLYVIPYFDRHTNLLL